MIKVFLKSDPKHHQHNDQFTSPSAPKNPQTVPSQVSPTQQIIKKDSSPPMQSKQLASSQVQNVKIMTKPIGTRSFCDPRESWELLTWTIFTQGWLQEHIPGTFKGMLHHV